MTFTTIEIALLCSILRVEKLAGWELPLLLSNEQEKEAYAALETKSILKEKHITPYGYTCLQILELYVKAKQYVRIESSIFANYKQQEYVSMTQTDDDFTLLLLCQDELVVIIASKFQTWNTVEEEPFIEREVSKENFASFMEENPTLASLFYTSSSKEKEDNDVGVLFMEAPYFKQYNVKTETLKQYPLSMVQEGIESIFQ